MRSRWNEEAPVVLSSQGLVKKYGQRTVVNGVSFEVHEGEVVGLLGPNGAGKTTSFRMTCGLINVNAGRVFLGGKDVTSWPMYRRAREGGMGYLPQDHSAFGTLSAEKNLYLAMEMIGIPRSQRKKRCEELLDRFSLRKVRKTKVGYGGTGGLSGGERRRLEIARALLSEPRILLLDEPFANVDPNTVTEIQHVVQELSRDGIAVLITDHQIDATMEIADYCYVIADGAVFTRGTPVEVLSDPNAQKGYFGEKSQQQLDNLLKRISNEEAQGRHAPAARRPSAARSPMGYVVEDADEEIRSFRVTDRDSEEEEVIVPRDRIASKMFRGQSIYRRRK
ncbi:MAG: LPS export ABC transporter ATP-binding protein [Thermoguttaceae bacterium]|nr:LPS export ABC transporter ATP-binding protein [Thermoguttaceae bacterium]